MLLGQHFGWLHCIFVSSGIDTLPYSTFTYRTDLIFPGSSTSHFTSTKIAIWLANAHWSALAISVLPDFNTSIRWYNSTYFIVKKTKINACMWIDNEGFVCSIIEYSLIEISAHIHNDNGRVGWRCSTSSITIATLHVASTISAIWCPLCTVHTPVAHTIDNASCRWTTLSGQFQNIIQNVNWSTNHVERVTSSRASREYSFMIISMFSV